MQYRSVLADVDGVAGDHLASMLKNLGLFRQVQQELQYYFCDSMFRQIDVESPKVNRETVQSSWVIELLCNVDAIGINR